MSRRAFTLIELLVVVAIIALLAGMLLPVLSNARTKAKTAGCQSNMKNLGLALYMYTQDHDNYLGWHSATGTGAGCTSYTWYELYTPYTEGTAVFRDPARRSDARGTQHGLTAFRPDVFQADYAMNTQIWRSTTSQVKNGEVVVAFVGHRSGGGCTPWFFSYSYKPGVPLQPEGRYSTSLDGGPNGTWQGTRADGSTYNINQGRPDCPGERQLHGTGRNFLFVDGHVQFNLPDSAKRDWFKGRPDRRWRRTVGILK